MNLIAKNLQTSITKSKKLHTKTIDSIINRIKEILLSPASYDTEYMNDEIIICFNAFFSGLRVVYPDRKDLESNIFERVFKSHYFIYTDSSTKCINRGSLSPFGAISDDVAVEIQILFDTWNELRKSVEILESNLSYFESDNLLLSAKLN